MATLLLKSHWVFFLGLIDIVAVVVLTVLSFLYILTLEMHKYIHESIRITSNGSAAHLTAARILNSTLTMKSACAEEVTRVARVIKQKTKKQKFYAAISSSGVFKARLLYFTYTKIRKDKAK